jgi:hypothetical protein
MRASKLPALLTRRHVLHGAVTLAASSLLPGCGTSGSSISSTKLKLQNAQPIPLGPMTTATVAVSSIAAGSIGSEFMGLSYEKASLYETLFTASNSNLIGLFQRLGTGILRIGGATVDRNIWTPNGTGQDPGHIAPSDVNSLAAFVQATGWQCLYGINLGGASSGTTTTALASAEVAYAAEHIGTSLSGIEIGNEPDLWGNAGSYYAGHWTLEQYETLWEQYRAAIVASTPTVSVTGPAAGENESTWTVPFGQHETNSKISLLTQHYYRGSGAVPLATAEFLISPDPTLIANLSTLEIGATGIGVPFRLAECNSFFGGGASGVSNSYASSLWVLDFMYDCALGGCSGVNFHGGGNGTGYQPIADNAGVVVEARPEYYGLLLFSLAGTGTLYQTTVSAGSLNVTTYAIKDATGNFNIIVINKDLTQNLQLTIQLPQNGHEITATGLVMTQLSSGATGPSLTATEGVMIQGSVVAPDGAFAPGAPYDLTTSGVAGGNITVNCYVPALSALLIQTT